MSNQPVRMPSRILLVDDDPHSLDSTRKILELSGYEVVTATDGQHALDFVRTGGTFDLVVSDVRMPRLGGLEFLRALSLCGEQTPVVMMTAFGRVEDAVWAMKLGAVDFLMKPFKRQALLSAVENALKRTKKRESPQQLLEKPGAESLLGTSEPMQLLRRMISQVASTSATVLITGESGSGKERVAKLIHEQGPRAQAKFIALNCAAVPEQLIESELFGFEKGAFTGATNSKEGLFEAANGGTLLLDEIGDMPIGLQAKLLRTLQEGEVRRIGATVSKKVDVRVIAATHRDLKENVRLGTFRQDLLFRLEVISIVVPTLKERLEDIPQLAAHFLNQASRRHGKQVNRISDQALATLLLHTWPGNVRELSNVIERGIVFASADEIELQDLPPHLQILATQDAENPIIRSLGAFSATEFSVKLGTPLREVEDLLIRKTLEATSGDKNMTAKLLGINRPVRCRG